VGGEFFRKSPDRACGPPSLLYGGDRVSFVVIKRPGCGVDYALSFRAEVTEAVELLYSRTPNFNFQLML
jgi:hypothetical protein